MKVIAYSLFVLLALGLAIDFCVADANFTGKWKYNEKQSDNPRDKFQKARQDGGGSGGGWSGGHHGGFGGPSQGMGQGYGHRGDSDRRSGSYGPPQEMTIAYTDSELKITDENGKVVTLYTDGRKAERETPDGRKVPYTSHWEDESLIVESQRSDGTKVTETYELAPDRKQLYVKLRMPLMMTDETVTILRVYDAEPAEAASQSAPAQQQKNR
jgi:hypothetical protein